MVRKYSNLTRNFGRNLRKSQMCCVHCRKYTVYCIPTVAMLPVSGYKVSIEICPIIPVRLFYSCSCTAVRYLVPTWVLVRMLLVSSTYVPVSSTYVPVSVRARTGALQYEIGWTGPTTGLQDLHAWWLNSDQIMHASCINLRLTGCTRAASQPQSTDEQQKSYSRFS